MLGLNVNQQTRSSIPTISGLALIHPGVVETFFSWSPVQVDSPIAKFNSVFSDSSMKTGMEFFVYPVPVWTNAQKRDQIPASPRSGS